MGTRKRMILVPFFYLTFLVEFAACGCRNVK
jgi:hypothetical protein